MNITNILLSQFIEATLLQLGQIFKQAKYLEVGCGDLKYRKFVPQKWDCTFTDVERRTDESILFADVQRLPFNDKSFDVVLMTEVIEHVEFPDVAIAEVSRVLKDNGYLIITFPFLYGLHELPNDYTRWTEFKAQKAFSRNNLSIQSFSRRGDCIGVILTLVINFGSALSSSLQHGYSKWALNHLFIKPTLGAVRLCAKIYLRSISKNSSQATTGEGLRGPSGSRQLWHLGYQFICKKDA